MIHPTNTRTKMPVMKVSVVIPCFNCIKYIDEALKSVYNQTYQELEVIVVDDGSSDGSREYLYKLKSMSYPELIVLCHSGGKNLGVSSSRALGVGCASGDYIAFLDADDVFLDAAKLDRQVAILSAQRDVVMVHTSASHLGGSLHGIESKSFSKNPLGVYDFRSQASYLRNNYVCNSSVLIRGEGIRGLAIDVYQHLQFEDWVCWALLSAAGKFYFIPEPMTGYRVHSNQFTSTLARGRINHLYALLEMKHILFMRSQTSWHSVRVFCSLIRTFLEITRVYAYFPLDGTLVRKRARLNPIVRLYNRLAMTILKCSPKSD
jgi:glycosyltransferase involved in cell wall biosynthesis